MQVLKVQNIDVEWEGDFNCFIVKCDVVTRLGRFEFYDCVNDDKTVEVTDSNVLHNCIDDFGAIFDLSEKPGLMPVRDYLSKELDFVVAALNKHLSSVFRKQQYAYQN